MSVSVNRVIIAGNLTRNPEVRYLGNEQAVANFGLAVNRKYRDKSGEMVDDTTFVDVTAWGRTGELCGQFLTKGSPALIEGRLKLERWEAKDGSNRSKLGVVAESVQFLGSPDNRERPGRSEREPSRPRVPEPQGLHDDSDEPPF